MNVNQVNQSKCLSPLMRNKNIKTINLNKATFILPYANKHKQN